jgi:hypothetical protein
LDGPSRLFGGCAGFAEMRMSRRNHATAESGRSNPAVLGGGDEGLEQIRQALEGIDYGEVRLLVQNGVIVQIERVEKRRLNR